MVLLFISKYGYVVKTQLSAVAEIGMEILSPYSSNISRHVVKDMGISDLKLIYTFSLVLARESSLPSRNVYLRSIPWNVCVNFALLIVTASYPKFSISIVPFDYVLIGTTGSISKVLLKLILGETAVLMTYN